MNNVWQVGRVLQQDIPLNDIEVATDNMLELKPPTPPSSARLQPASSRPPESNTNGKQVTKNEVKRKRRKSKASTEGNVPDIVADFNEENQDTLDKRLPSMFGLKRGTSRDERRVDEMVKNGQLRAESNREEVVEVFQRKERERKELVESNRKRLMQGDPGDEVSLMSQDPGEETDLRTQGDGKVAVGTTSELNTLAGKGEKAGQRSAVNEDIDPSDVRQTRRDSFVKHQGNDKDIIEMGAVKEITETQENAPRSEMKQDQSRDRGTSERKRRSRKVVRRSTKGALKRVSQRGGSRDMVGERVVEGEERSCDQPGETEVSGVHKYRVPPEVNIDTIPVYKEVNKGETTK